MCYFEVVVRDGFVTRTRSGWRILFHRVELDMSGLTFHEWTRMLTHHDKMWLCVSTPSNYVPLVSSSRKCFLQHLRHPVFTLKYSISFLTLLTFCTRTKIPLIMIDGRQFCVWTKEKHKIVCFSCVFLKLCVFQNCVCFTIFFSFLISQPGLWLSRRDRCI